MIKINEIVDECWVNKSSDKDGSNQKLEISLVLDIVSIRKMDNIGPENLERVIDDYILRAIKETYWKQVDAE